MRSLLQDTDTEAVCNGVGTCASGVDSGCKFGDVNGDCSFDVSDVLALKRAIMGKSYDADFDLSVYSDWQRQQMDPNLDWLKSGAYVSPDAADSLYLLHALSKKARFIDVTNGLTSYKGFLTYEPGNATDVLLDMEVRVYDESSEAATSDDTKVRSNSVSMVGPIQVTTMPSPPLVLELPIIPQSVQSTRPVTCGLQQQIKEVYSDSF